MNVNFLNLEYLLGKILGWLSALTTEGFLEWLIRLLEQIRPYSMILSLIFLSGIIYCVMKIKEIEQETHAVLYPKILNGTSQSLSDIKNARWEKVLKDVASDNPNDWRHAIIEADVMLDEMVSGMGYHGDTLGEKMKAIEPSDFATIENAWEAHKIRNMIAHGGSGYELSARDAKRAIHLYRTVFEEFKFI